MVIPVDPISYSFHNQQLFPYYSHFFIHCYFEMFPIYLREEGVPCLQILGKSFVNAAHHDVTGARCTEPGRGTSLLDSARWTPLHPHYLGISRKEVNVSVLE